MERKSFRLEIKDLGEMGTFTGHANAFNNVDTYGDIVQAGAFKQTLSKWRSKGRPIPLLWQHDETQPIGYLESATEDSKGLAVTGRLLLDVTRAREARELLAAHVLGGMSIGYATVKSRTPSLDEAKNGARRILEELRLWEVSLVTFPANEDATVTHVKQVTDLELELKTLREELVALRDGRAAGQLDTAEPRETDSAEAKASEELRAMLATLTDYTTRRRR